MIMTAIYIKSYMFILKKRNKKYIAKYLVVCLVSMWGSKFVELANIMFTYTAFQKFCYKYWILLKSLKRNKFILFIAGWGWLMICTYADETMTFCLNHMHTNHFWKTVQEGMFTLSNMLWSFNEIKDLTWDAR